MVITGPMRAMLLADELLKQGNKVTIISSSFFHSKKIFRSKSFKKVNLQENFSIILIPSLGYKKHIGFKRLFDHIVLSINLYQFLRNNKSSNLIKFLLAIHQLKVLL